MFTQTSRDQKVSCAKKGVSKKTFRELADTKQKATKGERSDPPSLIVMFFLKNAQESLRGGDRN